MLPSFCSIRMLASHKQVGKQGDGFTLLFSRRAFAPHQLQTKYGQSIFEKRKKEYKHLLWCLHVDTHIWKIFLLTFLTSTNNHKGKKSVFVPTKFEKPVESIRDCSSALSSQEELLRVTCLLSKNTLSMQKETLGQKSPPFIHLGA